MDMAQSSEVPAPIADDIGPHAPEGAHAVPRRILLTVYFTLVVLTAITWAVSRVDLGQANIWIALGVAFIKASIVALYFMHLRWDSPFNGIVLIAAFFFVALFIGISMLDSHTYRPSLKPVPTPNAVINQ
jgi:cytochrome c oxidase subunit 4